jgi:hypothetical protein
MKSAQVKRLIRRTARNHNLTVEPREGGKGSHQKFALVDSSGAVVATFTLTDHPRELSWTVLRSVEDALTPQFGAKWMEKDQ